MAKRFKVGGNCDCWCTKCKLVLEHVIIAMVEKKPKRVECTTCKSQHNYRLAPGGKASKSKSTRKKTTKKATAKKGRKTNWTTLVSARDLSQARDYKVSATFEEDELIDHSMFGVGVVLEAVPGNKIQVLFEEGAKLLVHSR